MVYSPEGGVPEYFSSIPLYAISAGIDIHSKIPECPDPWSRRFFLRVLFLIKEASINYFVRSPVSRTGGKCFISRSASALKPILGPFHLLPALLGLSRRVDCEWSAVGYVAFRYTQRDSLEIPDPLYLTVRWSSME